MIGFARTMPIIKPVVFISSTAKDLQEHREAAARAARQAGFEAQMMEDFEAQSLKPPYPACLEKVRDCDVLIVIVAHRYGWAPQDQAGHEVEEHHMARVRRDSPRRQRSTRFCIGSCAQVARRT